MTLMVSKERCKDSKVREEGMVCSHTGGRVRNSKEKNVEEALKVSGSELSPSVHYTVVKALFRENDSIFLLEQVGKGGSKPYVSPFKAHDGSLGFLPTKQCFERRS